MSPKKRYSILWNHTERLFELETEDRNISMIVE